MSVLLLTSVCKQALLNGHLKTNKYLKSCISQYSSHFYGLVQVDIYASVLWSLSLLLMLATTETVIMMMLAELIVYINLGQIS